MQLFKKFAIDQQNTSFYFHDHLAKIFLHDPFTKFKIFKEKISYCMRH